jgi:hypothetical protein
MKAPDVYVAPPQDSAENDKDPGVTNDLIRYLG